MKITFARPSGRSIHVNVSEVGMKTTSRTKWIEGMVKIHAHMGIDESTLAERFGKAYDTVVPPKKEVKPADEKAEKK